MKMKLPPFEAWYLALILALAFIFCGCTSSNVTWAGRATKYVYDIFTNINSNTEKSQP
jgi:hypothetical protein